MDDLEARRDLDQLRKRYPKAASHVGLVSRQIGPEQFEGQMEAPDDVLELIRNSQIERKPVEWFWTGRIAAGKYTVMAGDPGVGKSYASADIAAAFTVGRALPGDRVALIPPCDALIISYEDDEGDTIGPRLDRCGADTSRIQHLKRERPFTLADVPALDNTLGENPSIRVVIIDPFGAALVGVDAHRDSEVRSATSLLLNIAKKRKVAIIGIAHLNKAALTQALYRVGGSIAQVALARSALVFGTHGGDGKHFCVQMKNNLAPLAPALEYKITDKGFEWGDVVQMTASELLSTQPPERTAEQHDKAMALLDELFADASFLSATEIIAEARRRGISRNTLERARKDKGIEAHQERSGGKFKRSFWVAPAESTSPDTTSLANNEMVSGESLDFTSPAPDTTITMRRDLVSGIKALETPNAVSLKHWKADPDYWLHRFNEDPEAFGGRPT